MTEDEQVMFDAGMAAFASAIEDGDWDQAAAYARALCWLEGYHERQENP